jgi:hypothetical protein
LASTSEWATTSSPCAGRAAAEDAGRAGYRLVEGQAAHLDDIDGVLRGRLAAVAEKAGLPVGRLAESFQVIATA